MAISCQKLSYVYAADMPYRYEALHALDLEIKEGKITAIIGETGSGKSTLLQHFNALLLPSAGQIAIAGFKIVAGEKQKNLKQLRQKVGLVFQFSEYQLFEETVLKDVAFGPKNFHCPEEVALKKAAQALKLVGIGADYYERSPLDLSGGQKRRVAIAGILAMEPEIVVLDEPTAGLDPQGAKEIIELFVTLNKKYGKTIIIVTHDNELVYNYADEVVLLSKGTIKAQGTPHEFFNDEALVTRYHLLRPAIVQLIALLKERGLAVPSEITNIKELVTYLKQERRKRG